MAKYQYTCQTATVGHTWQIEATFPSHTMALEYGSHIVKDFVGCRWFSQLNVWMIDDDAQSLVGFITLDDPTSSIKAA